MSTQRPLHRLFGLSWVDFFRGTDVTVEQNMDLSLKQQLLDLVLIRHSQGPLPRPLPDGFDDFGEHNLITFKSYQEPLDDWTLLELIGHFVNYRKQCSPSFDDLLPVEQFRLYAVCVRFPRNLAAQAVLRAVSPGVYSIDFVGRVIRVIVVHQLPLEQ